ncbi:MAG: hypothetical protein A2Y76_05960 [Planctomycetes bacterium RBG_13_60_9]|nr:MAG: hypothetical protein A2Y76_05960 [Planctomycetes bacterium RBG_13_60_9]
MKRIENLPHAVRPGSALVLSLIFVVMFSALAAAMAAVSSSNVQIAENHRKLDNTRASAESGMEVMRYWMSKVEMSGLTENDQRFTELATSLGNLLSAADVNNMTLACSSSSITIPNVPLNSDRGQSFSAVLTKIDANSIQLDVTGHYGSLQRNIQSSYQYFERADSVFDYGVATKGPLSLSGNIEIEGVNIDVESNAYIDCEPLLALSIIGNSMIAGDVKIVNPLADVHLQGGHAGVGGESGTAAMDHIELGAPPASFPEMDPSQFTGYATNVLCPTADLSQNATYENLRIPQGRNPHFSGQTTLRGVIFVEAPNVVTFSGNVDVTAIIVTNGDDTDNSGTNQLTFTGNITGHPISQLPEQPQFADIRNKTGTFIMAPGFRLGFGGNFSTLSGAIAGNGIELWGNAGGVVNGSIINYSNTAMTLTGNSDLQFNRSGLTEIPTGFVPTVILRYDPSSYCEPSL